MSLPLAVSVKCLVFVLQHFTETTKSANQSRKTEPHPQPQPIRGIKTEPHPQPHLQGQGHNGTDYWKKISETEYFIHDCLFLCYDEGTVSVC